MKIRRFFVIKNALIMNDTLDALIRVNYNKGRILQLFGFKNKVTSDFIVLNLVK